MLLQPSHVMSSEETQRKIFMSLAIGADAAQEINPQKYDTGWKNIACEESKI